MAALRRLAKELEDTSTALSVKIRKRSTRGVRQNELEGEDAEIDNEFWGDGCWDEGANDEYSSEPDQPDVFDDDFNLSEDSESEGEDVEAEKQLKRAERKETKKALGAYQEPKRPKTRPSNLTPKRSKDKTDNEEQSNKNDKDSRKKVASSERSMRKSTISKTQNSAKERKALAGRPKGEKEYAPKLYMGYKQKDMLLEAAQTTEHDNLNWVVQQSKLIEETKNLEVQHRYNGPYASSYISGRGFAPIVIFASAESVPDILKDKAKPKAHSKNLLCKVTGLPAKYRDPLTGQPYSNASAFSEIRRRLLANNIKKKEKERISGMKLREGNKK